MGFVVLRKKNIIFKVNFFFYDLGDKQFLPKLERHGLNPGAKAFRCHRQVAHQKTLKGQKRFIIKYYVINVVKTDSRLLQEVLNGIFRKAWIVFFPSEKLLLVGGHDVTVS